MWGGGLWPPQRAPRFTRLKMDQQDRLQIWPAGSQHGWLPSPGGRVWAAPLASASPCWTVPVPLDAPCLPGNNSMLAAARVALIQT